MKTVYKHIVKWDFETVYTKLRQQENRVYTDAEVAALPVISPKHPHHREWMLRRESSQRLVDYLRKKRRPLSILEIGCGNGWLCNRLSNITDSSVIGTDINFSEIQQAANVFQHIPNLHFMYVSVEPGVFREKKFDVIVFAAAIQYFGCLSETVQQHLPLLKDAGEIHILDSPFYSGTERRAARLRSQHYYEKAGFPEMNSCYFHHTYEELQGFDYEVCYDPRNLVNRILGMKNPFPWLCIRQQN